MLEIVVRRAPRNQYRGNVLIGKLTLVDLAGSERAAETNNIGQKLRDGEAACSANTCSCMQLTA